MSKNTHPKDVLDVDIINVKEVETETEIVEVTEFPIWLDTKCNKINNELLELLGSDSTIEFIYPQIIKILKTDNKYRRILTESATDIEDALDRFEDIVALVNKKTVFIPEIENFSAFMGWSSKKYKQMLASTDEEICEAMQLVDDYIIACQFNAGQLGITKGNITKFRTQLAGSHGQGLVTAKESNDINKGSRQDKTPEQMLKELSRMGFDTQLAEKIIK